MRTLIGGLVVLAVTTAACGGSADKTADATTDSSAMMAAAEPAGLTAADVAGTWTGTTFAEAGDSVTQRWTIMSVSDSEGKLVMDGSTDTVSYTVMFSGDSAVATSAPYTDAMMPAGSPQMTWRSVGRLSAGRFVGTSAVMAVTAPDSVLVRGRWEATRAP